MTRDDRSRTERDTAGAKSSGKLYISGMGYAAPKYRKEEAETPPDYKTGSGGFNIRMRAKGYVSSSGSASSSSSGSDRGGFGGFYREYDPNGRGRYGDSYADGGYSAASGGGAYEGGGYDPHGYWSDPYAGGGYGSGAYGDYTSGYGTYGDGKTIGYGMEGENPYYMVDPSTLGIILVDQTDGMREITLSTIRKSVLLLGRDKDNVDILIQAKSVGRQHGSFRYQDGAYYYCDENSTNGTYYLNNGNYVRVESNRLIGPLKEGMTFLLGGSRTEDHSDRESVLMIVTSRSNDHPYTKFALNEQQYTIGRGEDCDIVLDQPAVSRHHARVYYYNDRYVIEDSGSRNGVFLNGVKIRGSAYINEKDIIQIAGKIIIYSCNMLFCQTATTGIQLTVSQLYKKVNHGRKIILNNVNCNIESNEFIAIVGGSGAGKSTLLKALGGYDQDYIGNVLFNGIPLRKYYHILKNIIGYVPQEDIVFENLTLRKMLYYTAEMKMEKGTTRKEIDKRILEVLSLVELSEHQNTMIRNLSGGQKKRASIAVELLADPGMFFLDEPTSGLDPGTEQKLMRVLNRLSKTQGKTIVMVTHTTQSLELCDRIMFMGKGGRLSFFGTPKEALDFFNTDSLVNIYNMLEENTDYWADQFERYNYSDSYEPARNSENFRKTRQISFIKQLSILTTRYMNLIVNDHARLFLMFMQPLIISFLIKVVSSKKLFVNYEPTKQILFTYACSAIWVGIFNTIQEVCKERAILKREYMSNLRLTAYIMSKYLVQLFISMLQALIFAVLFVLLCGSKLEVDGAGIMIFLTTWLTIYSSSAMGLLVSSMMKNSDRAMAMSPFLLIVQLLFSGVLFKLKAASKLISVFTISRWSIGSLGNNIKMNSLPSQYEFMEHVAEDMYKHNIGHLIESWGMMILFIIVFALLSIFFLRNVSKDR